MNDQILAGGVAEIQRVVFLRGDGRRAEADRALEAWNQRAGADAAARAETEASAREALALLRAEREERTGSAVWAILLATSVRETAVSDARIAPPVGSEAESAASGTREGEGVTSRPVEPPVAFSAATTSTLTEPMTPIPEAQKFKCFQERVSMLGQVVLQPT